MKQLKFSINVNVSGEEELNKWIAGYPTIEVKQRRSSFKEGANRLFVGDNLDSLIHLYRAGERFDFIYTDPPYNTKKRQSYQDDNADWSNNMFERLYLARKLLSKNGVIFISIDDHSFHKLRLICNEAFGEDCFVCTFVWKKKSAPFNMSETPSVMHEYILFYALSKHWRHKRLDRTEESDVRFKFKDKSGRKFTLDTLSHINHGRNFYIIKDPVSGIVYEPTHGGWTLIEKSFLEYKKDGRIIFPSDKRFNLRHPMRVSFQDEARGMTPHTWINSKIASSTSISGMYLNKLIGDKSFFYPKPVELVSYFLEISSKENNNQRVLDLWSGSGTTGESVIRMNVADGGLRTFTLLQRDEKIVSNEIYRNDLHKNKYNTVPEVIIKRFQVLSREMSEGLFSKDQVQEPTVIDVTQITE